MKPTREPSSARFSTITEQPCWKRVTVMRPCDVARREKPDLITLDITMPGKDGGEVFEELRKDPALQDIPVCIISAHPDLRRLIYQRNVRPPDGYLDKPIDEKGLLLNVRKTLALARRRHAK